MTPTEKAVEAFPVLFGYSLSDELRHARKAGLQIVVLSIPWPMLVGHERQARENHSQSLRTLASRGGLSACEALAIIEDRPWRRMTFADAHQTLANAIGAWRNQTLTAAPIPQQEG